ncbi:nucleoside-diphosphate sugar epimerase [Ferviditalea candida]|uniref:Nucleoside-diphosphate sugar epimerase n=1 Tax=Ferviditalea candida TaxID=3108399 RepID=A0ABU5ZDY7_9BACL|nr:nucleoside-diphosphate sugar epimerase [Paenibacillaceae bacterium T2]
MIERITSIIVNMVKSHHELARILEAKKDIAVRMSQVINTMPNQEIPFQGVDAVKVHTLSITKSVTVYLNSLADLEEALSENLTLVMNELSENQDDGE